MEIKTEVVKSEEVLNLLDKLFKDYDVEKNEVKVEVDWGKLVGNEVNL